MVAAAARFKPVGPYLSTSLQVCLTGSAPGSGRPTRARAVLVLRHHKTVMRPRTRILYPLWVRITVSARGARPADTAT